MESDPNSTIYRRMRSCENQYAGAFRYADTMTGDMQVSEELQCLYWWRHFYERLAETGQVSELFVRDQESVERDILRLYPNGEPYELR